MTEIKQIKVLFIETDGPLHGVTIPAEGMQAIEEYIFSGTNVPLKDRMLDTYEIISPKGNICIFMDDSGKANGYQNIYLPQFWGNLLITSFDLEGNLLDLDVNASLEEILKRVEDDMNRKKQSRKNTPPDFFSWMSRFHRN